MADPARAEMPCDYDAERRVLGGLMFDRDAADLVLSKLRSDDFYDGKHGVIYAAIEDVAMSGQFADIGSVGHQLTKAGKLSTLGAVGGVAYLVELANEVATSQGIEQQAAIIREHAIVRRIICLGDELQRKGRGRLHGPSELLAIAQTEIGAIADVTVPNKPIRLKRGLFEVFDDLKRMEGKCQFITGVPSGLDDLDELTAGYQPGELIVIAGRPSMGKTAKVIGNMMAAAAKGMPSLLFSMEMGRKAIHRRILSWESSVDGMLLRSGLIRDDMGKIERGVSRILNYPILVDDSSLQTLVSMRTVARKWRRDVSFFSESQPLGAIFVDYLQLVTPLESKTQINREREIAIIAQGLKSLAKELHVPVVTLAQINRATENRADHRPSLGDLRESGALEQVADVVIGLYRDEYYNKKSEEKGIAELLVLKQREGAVGTVRCAYLPKFTRFANLARHS